MLHHSATKANKSLEPPVPYPGSNARRGACSEATCLSLRMSLTPRSRPCLGNLQLPLIPGRNTGVMTGTTRMMFISCTLITAITFTRRYPNVGLAISNLDVAVQTSAASGEAGPDGKIPI
jgi:hypothetical protein